MMNNHFDGSMAGYVWYGLSQTSYHMVIYEPSYGSGYIEPAFARRDYFGTLIQMKFLALTFLIDRLNKEPSGSIISAILWSSPMQSNWIQASVRKPFENYPFNSIP